MFEYDYLVVGSGLFGSVFARSMTDAGFKCLVIDQRNHTGGNVFCENIEEINVHKYGPHIFHTNDKKIWDYVNSFVQFNRFTYSPLANYKGELYNLPFNMNTFSRLWDITDPEDAKKIIDKQIIQYGVKNPKNLEEQAINLVGKDIYTKLIKGYTEKQWGRKATELPAFIIKRLPVRFTYDNNYFNDMFQGIPIGGYNKLIDALLNDIEVKLNFEYKLENQDFNSKFKKIVYTGPIDKLFNYEIGVLNYRSLRFENKVLELVNFQGCAGINYTDFETPYTRIIEHKHFQFGKQKNTVITKEFPLEWKLGLERYYPVNDSRNNKLFDEYKYISKIRDESNKFIFGGRLADYKYYDMHQVIASALTKSKKEIIERKK